MSQPPASPRTLLTAFGLFVLVAASLYAFAPGPGTQSWMARTLAALIAADGICDCLLAAYLRFVRGRPRRNEGLFLAASLAAFGIGWYALLSGASLMVVAIGAVVVVGGQRLLKPHIIDTSWAAESVPATGT